MPRKATKKATKTKRTKTGAGAKKKGHRTRRGHGLLAGLGLTLPGMSPFIRM